MFGWLRRPPINESVCTPASSLASQELPVIDGQVYWHLDHFNGPDVIERVEFRDCKFFDCHTKPSKEPQSRSILREIRLTGCSHAHGSILGSIIEDVTVDGLKNYGNSPLFAWGAVFKHVTLKGRISSAIFNSEVKSFPGEGQREWDEANAAFYAACDWAFDISDAKFTSSFELRSVPGTLIRRDPETQVLVTRERLRNNRWRALDLAHYTLGISAFLETELDSTVFIAPKANKKFKEDLAYLQLLRDSGFAEPD